MKTLVVIIGGEKRRTKNYRIVVGGCYMIISCVCNNFLPSNSKIQEGIMSSLARLNVSQHGELIESLNWGGWSQGVKTPPKSYK